MQNTIVDTSITDTSYLLPRLNKSTTYYWRVAGINSEGQSRWSDLWHFTTGTNAGAAAQMAPVQDFAFTPNPADKYITVALPDAGSHEVSVYDILGRRVKQIAINATPLGQIDVGGLAEGPYIVVVDHTSRTMLRVEHSGR